MTDTLHKNPESCTVSDTPESNALHDKLDKELAFMCERDDLEAALVDMLNLARKLERERDEARFDLAFRRDLYRLQEERVQELEAEVKLWKENATSNRDVFDEMSKELDEARFDLSFSRDLYKLHEFQSDELRKQLAEAVSSCHIWQAGHSELVADRNRWMSLAGVRREDYLQATTLVNQLNKELAIIRKQNAEQLTLLQENGLAEYGN